MLIIGADLATQSGVCYGRPDTTPLVQTVRAPVCGDDLAAFGSFYWRFFTGLFGRLHERLEPGEEIILNYEQPVMIEKKWDEAKRKMVGGNPIVTTRKLQGLGMLLETAAQVYSEAHAIRIDVFESHLSTIKKELGGHGRADKEAMILAARRCGIVLPPGDEAKDAADAFGCWLLAIRYKAGRKDRDYWDRRANSGVNFRG